MNGTYSVYGDYQSPDERSIWTWKVACAGLFVTVVAALVVTSVLAESKRHPLENMGEHLLHLGMTLVDFVKGMFSPLFNGELVDAVILVVVVTGEVALNSVSWFCHFWVWPFVEVAGALLRSAPQDGDEEDL